MRELVLVHGRAQQEKDAAALKREWLDTLREGLAKSGLQLPIPENRVRFPYYGDTLIGLVRNLPADQVAEVIVKGSEDDSQFRDFVGDVLDEVVTQKGITEEEIEAEAALAARGEAGVVIERGVLNWRWVQAILAAIDRRVPGASGASIALFTRDVYQYLTHPGIRDVIEQGVRNAMSPGVESVVVGHSLGSVVSYNLLRREGKALGWRVPLYVTVGSPLSVSKIRNLLAPNKHPECVGTWFNAMDQDDVVALYPLDSKHFPLNPQVENKTDVSNQTENQHGIRGYLNDREVAKRIYDALVAA